MYAGLLEERLLYKPVEFKIESNISRHAMPCTNAQASRGTIMASLLHPHQKGGKCMRNRGCVGFESGNELQALNDQNPYPSLAGCYRCVHEDQKKCQDLGFEGGWQISEGGVVEICTLSEGQPSGGHVNSKLRVVYSNVLLPIQTWQKAMIQSCALVQRMSTLTPIRTPCRHL